MVALYLIYLVLRRIRGKTHHRSKADRPAWIGALILAGSTWIVSNLTLAGVISFAPEDEYSCTYLTFLGSHMAYIFWLALVLYKLVRKFWQLRLVGKKPPHALLAIFLLVIPYIVLLGVASYYSPSKRDEFDICHVEVNWQWPVFMALVLYLLLFAFLVAKIQKTIGEHHEIIRYTIFLATSFVFPLAELIVCMTSIDESIVAHRCLLTLVVLIVLGNMGHIFILVLRGRYAKTAGILPQDTLRELPAMSISSLSSTPIVDVLNTTLTDSPLELLSIPANLPPMLQRPRREGELMPEFERFVEGLPEDLAREVDRNRGYFAYKTRPRTRTVVEFDIDKAESYVNPD
ncbi:hypothetical protein PSACC_00069 [Paramicrosporidium saccamoebae]|uniref:Uncharacterized protein n=1 Tax=Paramicrosporidium saccamoebae TaxID=1246581 RepID=A0A2H9TQT0_9FUNG|nr:hypothetical protein PSACC_00069 [Paramicrosporidium saccamoebae]